MLLSHSLVIRITPSSATTGLPQWCRYSSCSSCRPVRCFVHVRVFFSSHTLTCGSLFRSAYQFSNFLVTGRLPPGTLHTARLRPENKKRALGVGAVDIKMFRVGPNSNSEWRWQVAVAACQYATRFEDGLVTTVTGETLPNRPLGGGSRTPYALVAAYQGSVFQTPCSRLSPPSKVDLIAT